MALKGVKVIELAGLAPVPYCGMVLADFGASVTRIDRTPAKNQHKVLSLDTLSRGKRSISVNLKQKEGVSVIKRLTSSADVLIEPFRPGVMEKLGLGPEVLMADNPRLIYARLTGFGQKGPLANKAGHDINYIAMAGVLSQLGRKNENPYPPINLVADFAGGGLMCALGIAFALFERVTSGKGQLIDANMMNGSAYLSTFLWTSRSLPIWPGKRGENNLDTGVGYYETYRTKDDKFVSVGSLEPQFYTALLKGLGLTEEEMPQFTDPEIMKNKFTELFLTKTRTEWTEVFKNLDACYAPVLERDEAEQHPQNIAVETFITNSEGKVEPGPAPKLSRTPAVKVLPKQPLVGEHTRTVLEESGFTSKEIEQLLDSHVVFQNSEPVSKI